MPTGLPPGLGINSSTGVISGVPITAGTYTFTVQVKDADGLIARSAQEVLINADPPLVMACPILDDATVGIAYSYTPTVTDHVGAPVTEGITFSITSGALPAGLSLNATTGEISGTPTTLAGYSFTLTVSGAEWVSASCAHSISVGEWWLARQNTTSGADTSIWKGSDALNYATQGTRTSPIAISSELLWLDTVAWLGKMGSGTATAGEWERIADTDWSDGVTSTSGTGILTHTRVRYVDGILFLLRSNGGTQYAVSTDKGLTFSLYDVPDVGAYASDIARLGTRWLMVSSNGNGYYSDQSVPSAWTSLTGFDRQMPLMASSTAAVTLTTAGVKRSTNGTAWGVVDATYTDFTESSGHGLYGGGTFMFTSAANTCSVLVSTDDGLTWARYTVTGADGQGQRLAYGNGKWVLMQGDNAFVSADNGATWAAINKPTGHASGMGYFITYALASP